MIVEVRAVPPFHKNGFVLGSEKERQAVIVDPGDEIDQLLDQVDSRYVLVIVAAKRARQINNYHHQLGEGTFDDNPPPLVESRSKNYLTMALEEIAQGKIKYKHYAVTSDRAVTVTRTVRRLDGCAFDVAVLTDCPNPARTEGLSDQARASEGVF